MPRQPKAPLDLDLDETTEYRVRVISHHRGTHTVFEGLTRFRIEDLPRYRGDHGPRKLLATHAAPGMEWVAPADYQPGASTLDNGLYVCVLLDRHVEPDTDRWRAQMEMSLDVLCVQEGLSGVTFS